MLNRKLNIAKSLPRRQAGASGGLILVLIVATIGSPVGSLACLSLGMVVGCTQTPKTEKPITKKPEDNKVDIPENIMLTNIMRFNEVINNGHRAFSEGRFREAKQTYSRAVETLKWTPDGYRMRFQIKKLEDRIVFCEKMIDEKIEVEEVDWPVGFPIELICVKIGEKFGYMNKIGELVIKPQFDCATRFSEGHALVKIGHKWRTIDNTGKYIEEPTK